MMMMDNESMMPDGMMYDEMMIAAGGPGGSPQMTDLEPGQPLSGVTEQAATVPYGGGNDTGDLGSTTVPLIYEDGGGTVNLHGKSSSSDRGKHRGTWSPANRTVRNNSTFNYNKVGVVTVSGARCKGRLTISATACNKNNKYIWRFDIGFFSNEIWISHAKDPSFGVMLLARHVYRDFLTTELDR